MFNNNKPLFSGVSSSSSSDSSSDCKELLLRLSPPSIILKNQFNYYLYRLENDIFHDTQFSLF